MIFFNSSRRAQSALEFVIIIGFALLIISALIVVFQNRIRDMQEDRDVTRVDQMYNLLLSEIDFAQQSRPFYSRIFYLPSEIGGQAYTITINDKVDVVLTYGGVDNVRFLSDDTRVIGQFNVPGRNVIYKDYVGRRVYVNTVQLPYIIIDDKRLFVDFEDVSDETYRWGSPGSPTYANDNHNGKVNINILKSINHALNEYPAAQVCDNLVRHGYNDWYLPAIGQLKHIYDAHYALQAFDYFEEFENAWYWSSTEHSQAQAYRFNFGDGSDTNVGKATSNRVRCVRDNN